MSAVGDSSFFILITVRYARSDTKVRPAAISFTDDGAGEGEKNASITPANMSRGTHPNASRTTSRLRTERNSDLLYGPGSIKA